MADDKKHKGLADNGDGEIIFNESGTSISSDNVDSDIEATEKNIKEAAKDRENKGLAN